MMTPPKHHSTWEQITTMGKYTQPPDFNFRILQTILDRVWSKTEFRVSRIRDGLLQFFFQTKDEMEAILDQTPWNVENHLLILTPASPSQLPPPSEFEWIECWVHLWGFPRFMISEAIGRKFLMRPDIKSIENRVMIHTGHKFYRMRVMLNILEPLKKCMSIQITPTLSYTGALHYERLQTICYACGRIGHIQIGCYYHPHPIDPIEIPYEEWILADTDPSHLFWFSDASQPN